MKSKLWKEIIVAVLLVSTILSFSPIAYGETTSVQQSIDAIKMEMKQAALAYVEPALKGELVPSSSLDPVLNSVKKNYEATKKLILASNLSEKEKQAKLKELEALYEEKIVKGLIPYIDAYNYATKYLDPLLKEIKEAEAKNDFLAVEKAYHKLSVQLKSRTSILYRFTGKAPRDLLLEKYKKPADAKRDELIIPVTIIMKSAEASQLYQAGKVEEAKKIVEEIQALAAKLSNTQPFHQALQKELERLQAIFFPTPVTPPSIGGGDSSGSSESSAQRALRIAKANAIAELTNYKISVKADYSPANWTTIEGYKINGEITIKASKTTADVTKALADAKADIDKVLTIDQEALVTAKTNAIAELTNYKISVKADYSPANWTTIEGYKIKWEATIDALTTIVDVSQALKDAKIEIDTVRTLVEVEAASIPAKFAPAANFYGTVSLPIVGADYTISVKLPSDPSKYDKDGKIKADGTSTVIYTVKHTASGKTADTGSVEVTTTIILKDSPVVIDASFVDGLGSRKFDFTFADDQLWRDAIYSIAFTNKNVSDYELLSVFQIKAGRIFSTNMSYGVELERTWTFKATGYKDVIVRITS
ncbi:hypothetical protein [Psychrobacillus sp.]|uniref:hemoblobin-interacting domain-containing protein n=1 Tax=Psychrobacillus sp. TaxID=1871623 RepID=UPI0028BD6133|nr:hypothetical protein [Psychrobacillus sp.]